MTRPKRSEDRPAVSAAKPSGLDKTDLSWKTFWLVLGAVILIQAWLKVDLADKQPWSWEQVLDWLSAMQVKQGGLFPAFGPAMASGPLLPGCYFFLISLPTHLSESPLALSWFNTALYSGAALFLAWRLALAFNRAAALAVVSLLSFHPVVIDMTDLPHNPNMAFLFLTTAFAALLGTEIGFGCAALASFCSVMALQCHAVGIIVFTLPLLWVLARLAGDGRWRFSWGGYACGALLGALGYLPFFELQWASHFQAVHQMVSFRQAMHHRFDELALRPLFFFACQPGYEVSSYFGARWRGFLEYFRYFQEPGDFWALLTTYSTFLATLYFAFLAWKPVFRSGRPSWSSLTDAPNLALYRLAAFSMPFWFFLAGRFDVKYAGLFFAWSYLPLCAWISSGWSRWTDFQRTLLAFAVAVLCVTGVSLHERIYAQRGADLGWSRYDYATVDSAAQLLGLFQPAKAAVVFADGNGATWTGKAIFGLAKGRYHWRGEPIRPYPMSAKEEPVVGLPDNWVVTDGRGMRGVQGIWIGPRPLSLQSQRSAGWRLWRYVDGMYIFENF